MTHPTYSSEPTTNKASTGWPSALSATPAAGQVRHRTAREQASQHIHDVTAFLIDVKGREDAGNAVPVPQPRHAVLDSFTSPLDRTRVQVLAAAAAHHLQGEQSTSAQRLHRLAQDNGARLQALRDQERRTALLGHRTNSSSEEEIATADQQRVEQEAVEDLRVFNAAAAIALGYVASGSIPTYTDLADLSHAQLGPVPGDPTPETQPQDRPQGRQLSTSERAKGLLTTVGKGLAQAVGPISGNDDVAANLSPVNLTQLIDQLADLAAALKAAQSGHPRSIKELLNVEQKPDEENEAVFDQDPANLDRDLTSTPWLDV